MFQCVPCFYFRFRVILCFRTAPVSVSQAFFPCPRCPTNSYQTKRAVHPGSVHNFFSCGEVVWAQITNLFPHESWNFGQLRNRKPRRLLQRGHCASQQPWRPSALLGVMQVAWLRRSSTSPEKAVGGPHMMLHCEAKVAVYLSQPMRLSRPAWHRLCTP